MKYKTTIILSIVLLSCNQVELKDLYGNWSYLAGNDPINNLYEFHINKNGIELTDGQLFKEKAKINLNKDIIEIVLIRDKIKVNYEIEYIKDDTLKLKNGDIYFRNISLENSHIQSYQLHGIPNDELLSEIDGFHQIIHYYRTNDDEIRIRCGNKIVELEDIPLFLEVHSTLSNYSPVVLLGEGIDLSDLKELYLVLRLSGKLKVYLGTKRNGINDTEIYRDRIEVWWDNVENFRKSLKRMPPPQPPQPNANKEMYLKENGIIINIKSEDDLEKLELSDKSKKYLIEIDKNLSIKHYIQLKKKLRKIKKSNIEIRTSIR